MKKNQIIFLVLGIIVALSMILGFDKRLFFKRLPGRGLKTDQDPILLCWISDSW